MYLGSDHPICPYFRSLIGIEVAGSRWMLLFRDPTSVSRSLLVNIHFVYYNEVEMIQLERVYLNGTGKYLCGEREGLTHSSFWLKVVLTTGTNRFSSFPLVSHCQRSSWWFFPHELITNIIRTETTYRKRWRSVYFYQINTIQNIINIIVCGNNNFLMKERAPPPHPLAFNVT